MTVPFDDSFAHHLGKVATLQKSFAQGTGLDTLQQKLRGKVQGGYCFGACATWLHLALAKEKPTAIDPAHAGLVQRMAKSAVRYDKARPQAAGILRDKALSGSSDRYDEIETRRQKEWDAAEEEAFEAMEQASRDWQARFSAASNDPEMKRQMDKVRTMLDEIERETHAKIKLRKETAQKLAQTRADQANRAGGAADVTVEQVKRLAWGILQKHEATSYTGALRAVRRVDAGQGHTVGDFVCALLQEPAFTGGRGMFVNFTTGKTAGGNASVLEPAGHAVALHRVDAGNYWLFEPNLGAYRVKSRKMLIYALVLIMADGYDKRVLGDDDDALVFCKTSETFPDQGEVQIDNGVFVERDTVKTTMKKMLESLAKTAYDAGVEAVRVRKEEGTDAKAVRQANEDLRDAFLHARLTQAAVPPSQVMERLVADFSFLRAKGRVEDTGLHALHSALDAIF